MNETAQTVEQKNTNIAEFLPISNGFLYFIPKFFIGMIFVYSFVVLLLKSMGIPSININPDIWLPILYSSVIVFFIMEAKGREKYFSDYWRRNVVGYKLVCWNDEKGEPQWKATEARYALFELGEILPKGKDGLNISLGGWFGDSSVWYGYARGQNLWWHSNAPQLEWRDELKITLKRVFPDAPLMTNVRYADNEGGTIVTTIDWLLLLFRYNNGNAPIPLSRAIEAFYQECIRIGLERDAERKKKDELATQLQEQANASREYVNQLLAAHAEEIRRRSVWEATMIEVLFAAIDKIKKTTRFFASTKGKEIREWLEEQFLLFAPLDDKRRVMFEHRKPVPGKSAPEESATA